MTEAGLLAERSPYKNSKEQKRFRHFQLLFTTTIMHELTHLFGTWLGLGKASTPPRKVTQKAKEKAEDKEPVGEPREGGVYMENAVFGGRLTMIKDPLDDEGQVSLPLTALVGPPAVEMTNAFRPVYHT